MYYDRRWLMRGCRVAVPTATAAQNKGSRTIETESSQGCVCVCACVCVCVCVCECVGGICVRVCGGG